MSLAERFNNLFFSAPPPETHNRPQYSFVVDTKNNEHAFYPDEKVDFSESIEGKNGFDLANAFLLHHVHPCDLLEITTDNLDGTQATEEFMYWGPIETTDMAIHLVLPPKPHKDMAKIIKTTIIGWKKLGRIDPQVWADVAAEFITPTD